MEDHEFQHHLRNLLALLQQVLRDEWKIKRDARPEKGNRWDRHLARFPRKGSRDKPL
jgi:hypothetical protein